MSLHFKNQAEFDRWQKTLAEKPRLRVAASMGERVHVTPAEATVRPAPAPRRRILPTRAALARAWACACWTALVTGAFGAVFCLGAACGAAQLASLLP